MVSVLQIRAARALLNWKQSKLAEVSGISVPAIARLEQFIGSPRSDTLRAIQTAFEANGIEFFGENGVNLCREVFRIDTFEGIEGMQKIWDDVVVACANRKSEFLMSSMDEKYWIDLYGDKVGDEMKRRFQAKIHSRLLIKEGNNLCIGSDDTYRCIPKAVFGQVPHFVYADRYALINWDPLRVVLIRSQSVADTFRRQFEFNWALGTPVQSPKVLFPLFEASS